MLEVLKLRLHAHRERHPDLAWEAVEKRLRENECALAVLQKMEDTGGEPDVIGLWENSTQKPSAGSPHRRRSAGWAGHFSASAGTGRSSPSTTGPIPITLSGAGGGM